MTASLSFGRWSFNCIRVQCPQSNKYVLCRRIISTVKTAMPLIVPKALSRCNVRNESCFRVSKTAQCSGELTRRVKKGAGLLSFLHHVCQRHPVGRQDASVPARGLPSLQVGPKYRFGPTRRTGKKLNSPDTAMPAGYLRCVHLSSFLSNGFCLAHQPTHQSRLEKPQA